MPRKRLCAPPMSKKPPSDFRKRKRGYNHRLMSLSEPTTNIIASLASVADVIGVDYENLNVDLTLAKEIAVMNDDGNAVCIPADISPLGSGKYNIKIANPQNRRFAQDTIVKLNRRETRKLVAGKLSKVAPGIA